MARVHGVLRWWTRHWIVQWCPVIMAVRGVSLNVKYAHRLIRFSISMLNSDHPIFHIIKSWLESTSSQVKSLRAKSKPKICNQKTWLDLTWNGLAPDLSRLESESTATLYIVQRLSPASCAIDMYYHTYFCIKWWTFLRSIVNSEPMSGGQIPSDLNVLVDSLARYLLLLPETPKGAGAYPIVLPRLDLARLDSTCGRLPVTSGDLRLVMTSKS
jgi:hypothetical protein